MCMQSHICNGSAMTKLVFTHGTVNVGPGLGLWVYVPMSKPLYGSRWVIIFPFTMALFTTS